MSNITGPFMLVPQAEWDELQRRLRYQSRVLDPSQPDKGKHSAETFMACYDPARYGDDWGHVAYCLEMALGTRKQDSL